MSKRFLHSYTFLLIISLFQILLADKTTIKMRIGGSKEFKLEIEDSTTGTEFLNLLPYSVKMSDLNSNEKYIYIDQKFTTNSQRYETINIGDFMLYGDNCLVIFYKTFSSGYSYTRLGKIQDTSELATTVGSSNVVVDFAKEDQDYKSEIDDTESSCFLNMSLLLLILLINLL